MHSGRKNGQILNQHRIELKKTQQKKGIIDGCRAGTSFRVTVSEMHNKTPFVSSNSVSRIEATLRERTTTKGRDIRWLRRVSKANALGEGGENGVLVQNGNRIQTLERARQTLTILW